MLLTDSLTHKWTFSLHERDILYVKTKILRSKILKREKNRKILDRQTNKGVKEQIFSAVIIKIESKKKKHGIDKQNTKTFNIYKICIYLCFCSLTDRPTDTHSISYIWSDISKFRIIDYLCYLFSPVPLSLPSHT